MKNRNGNSTQVLRWPRFLLTPLTMAIAVVLVCAVTVAWVFWDSEWMMYVRATPHFLLYGFPTDRFQEQLPAIESAAKAVLPAKPDPLRDHVAAYAIAGEKGLLTLPTELLVYNVPNEVDQGRVIEAVREAVKNHRTIPVRIDFYEERGRTIQGWKAGAPARLTRSVIVN